jgi:hypothetical protein
MKGRRAVINRALPLSFVPVYDGLPGFHPAAIYDSRFRIYY